MKKIHAILYIIVFSILISLPILQQLSGCFQELSLVENRALVKFPKRPGSIKMDSLQQWLSKYECYLNDHFGFRNHLIKGHALFHYFILADAPSKKVLKGKNNWWFLNNKEDGNNLDLYFGKTLFDSIQLNKIKQNILTLKKELASREIPLIIVMAPNKQSIYSECMPSILQTKRSNYSKADQINEIFSMAKVHYLDLREVLLAAKSKSPYPLYLKSDTHWNDLGAFYAYESIMEAVKVYFPKIPIQSLSDYQLNINKTPAEGDLAIMQHLNGYGQDSSITLKPLYTINYHQVADSFGDSGFIVQQKDSLSQLPRLLQWRDSFSKALVPFLSNSFAESTYLWRRLPDLNIIDQQKPDIVIIEFVERYSDLWLEVLYN